MSTLECVCSKSRTKHRPQSVTFLLSTSSDTHTHTRLLCFASYINRQLICTYYIVLSDACCTQKCIYKLHSLFFFHLADALQLSLSILIYLIFYITSYLTSKHQIKQSKHFTCQAEASFCLNRPFLVCSRCVQHLCVCNQMIYIAMKSSQLPVWCLVLVLPN